MQLEHYERVTLTRIVRLRPGLNIRREQNVATSFAFVPNDSFSSLDPQELFVGHYEAIRRSCQNYTRAGVLIFGMDQTAVPLGELWLDAEDSGPRAGVIGRHSECDLVIPASHISVSLRHIVVLVRRYSPGKVQIEVVDLATGEGFADEQGQTRHSVTSEGPMFLRIGTVSLFFMTTPGLFSGKESAQAAYRKLPPRMFVDETDFKERTQLRVIDSKEDSLPPSREQTRVRSKVGPVFGSLTLCERDETPVAAISYRVDRNRVVRSVGKTALSRGVLIGRYSRCHLGPKVDSEDSRISRVHLLIMQHGDEVIAVDTASTNGTKINGDYCKFKILSEGDEIDMGEGVKLLWNTAN